VARRRKLIRVQVCIVWAFFAAAIGFVSLSHAQTRTPARASTAAATSGPVVGVIAGAAGWDNPSQRLNQVLPHTRAHWLREGFDWNRIEPSPGRFVFRHYDRFMLLAAHRHEHVLALLYQAPRWAAPTQNSIPRDPGAYAAFVAAVVHRYGPHGTLWDRHARLRDYAVSTFDLWNEPYYDNGNNGRYDPARYARLVKAAGGAGHAADPSARLLLGAEMQGTLVDAKWLWWVDALYRAVPDLNNYFDGVAVHPYGRDITHRAPAIVGQAYHGYLQMRRIEIIRHQFVQHGAGSKPFWATEVGWPTCRSGSNRCVSLSGQLASLDQLMHDARTIWSGYVRAVFVYYYDDARNSSPDPESHYGLTYSNHVAKPILHVFRSFAQYAPVNAW
jgi:polysaccharide biosynthesis protein PslG